jgi:hypothetical protein
VRGIRIGDDSLPVFEEEMVKDVSAQMSVFVLERISAYFGRGSL